MNTDKIEMQLTEFRDAFLEWHPFVRLAIITVAAAIVAYFTPTLIAGLFGRMLNHLSLRIEFLVMTVCLILFSLIGYRLNRVWLVAGIFAIVLGGYQLSLALRMIAPGGLFDFLWKASLPIISILLNAALFTLGRRYADLDTPPDDGYATATAG